MAAGILPGLSSPAGNPAAGAASLLWPLQVPGLLLSSFGEYRYDHLHAGIDISTEGATGYKVLAADQGLIYRLKVEWRGYGRALYIRHPGGLITVYGHLERYEDATLGLERRVAARQAEAHSRYPGDIYLDPPLAVRRGQVIALSGESGVGLPHLHFEVRARDDQPLDPFAAGLSLPGDHRPPVIESLTLTSALPAGAIDGAFRERTVRLRARNGVFAADQPVRISGPFLAAVSGFDPVGAAGRSGLHTVTATLDGRPLYQLTLRTFRFDQYPQSGLIYDHMLSHLGPAKYGYRLVRLRGNDLAGDPAGGGSDGLKAPGAIEAPPGRHRIEVSVGDEAGNRSRARVDLIVLEAESPVPAAPASTDGSSSTPTVAPTLVGWPRFLEVLLPRALPSDPEPVLEGGASREPLAPFLRRGDSPLSAVIDYAQAARSPELAITASGKEMARLDLQARIVSREKGDLLRTGEIEISLPPRSRFDDGPLVALRTPLAAPPGLPGIGAALDLLPFGEALDQAATLTFHLDDAGTLPARALGIYRFDPDLNRWGYEGGDLDSAGRALSLRIHRYGRFALLGDLSAPLLSEIRPGNDSRDAGRLPRITARVEEIGMGLNDDGVAFELDGSLLESEFDPDRGQSRVLEPPSLSPGRHRLRVTATDRAGNVSAPVEVSFEVR